MIVSDSGTELTSQAMLRWRQERGVALHRARQAAAERIRLELQRLVPRRMPE